MKPFELTYKFTLALLVSLVLIVGCDDDRDTYVPVPVITTIQPYSGASPGETFFIFGGNFSTNNDENIVTIGGVVAKVIESAPNKLVVEVPDGAEDGPLLVTVNGKTGAVPYVNNSPHIFNVLDEVSITSVTPIAVSRLDTLTIEGVYFSATIAENLVTIQDIEVTVVSASLNELRVIVPEDTNAGSATLSVTAHEQTVTEDVIILEYLPFNLTNFVYAPVAGATSKKVSIVNENVAYVVGDDGGVFRSTAPGTWVHIPYGTEDLDDVHAFNESTALVCGSDGTLAKTTDGGANWTAISVLGTDETLRRMHFISDTQGWLVGSDGVIFKTTDGGDTWEDLNPIDDIAATGARKYGYYVDTGYDPNDPNDEDESGNPRFYGVFFVDANTGFVVGEFDRYLKTTDGGATWTTKLQTTGEDLTSVIFQDAQNGWITGKDNVILATSDGGTTWTDQGISLGSGGDDINDIAILSSTNIIAVADDHQLIKSEDGGASWKVVDLETTLGITISDHIEGIDAYGGKAIVVGEGSFIGY